jgi:hypothetical protein
MARDTEPRRPLQPFYFLEMSFLDPNVTDRSTGSPQQQVNFRGWRVSIKIQVLSKFAPCVPLRKKI